MAKYDSAVARANRAIDNYYRSSVLRGAGGPPQLGGYSGNFGYTGSARTQPVQQAPVAQPSPVPQPTRVAGGQSIVGYGQPDFTLPDRGAPLPTPANADTPSELRVGSLQWINFHNAILHSKPTKDNAAIRAQSQQALRDAQDGKLEYGSIVRPSDEQVRLAMGTPATGKGSYGAGAYGRTVAPATTQPAVPQHVAGSASPAAPWSDFVSGGNGIPMVRGTDKQSRIEEYQARTDATNANAAQAHAMQINQSNPGAYNYYYDPRTGTMFAVQPGSSPQPGPYGAGKPVSPQAIRIRRGAGGRQTGVRMSEAEARQHGYVPIYQQAPYNPRGGVQYQF